jgi:hypothetical protein
MTGRPTWALIDEARQALDIAEGLANTIARRRTGGDTRLAHSAAGQMRRARDLLLKIEREDESSP